MSQPGQPGQDVPDELMTKVIAADAQYDLDTPHAAQRWMDRQRAILDEILPAHEALVRAKIAEELREQARIEAERLAPYRKGNDAIENAIVGSTLAADIHRALGQAPAEEPPIDEMRRGGQ